MSRLGAATLRVAERAFMSRVTTDDTERIARLGDVQGQTQRATRFAETLEGSVLLEFADPETVKPRGWFR